MRPALLAALLLAVPVAAQMPTTPPGKPDPTLATAGRYHVDSGHTQVLFTVNHMGFSQYTGQFTQPTGSLTLDPRNAARSQVAITFPIDKVSTTVSALDEHLKKPEFFDATKYPTATFSSTSIVARGRTATITGNLTLKGVTRPVTLAATFVGAGSGVMGAKKTNVGFHATGTIKRSDWGVNYGVPIVSDQVELVINAAFEAD